MKLDFLLIVYIAIYFAVRTRRGLGLKYAHFNKLLLTGYAWST